MSKTGVMGEGCSVTLQPVLVDSAPAFTSTSRSTAALAKQCERTAVAEAS